LDIIVAMAGDARRSAGQLRSNAGQFHAFKMKYYQVRKKHSVREKEKFHRVQVTEFQHVTI